MQHVQPSQPEQPYAPDPAVIEQNESFEYALSVAPNELYARYRQYGQVSTAALFQVYLINRLQHSWASWDGVLSSVSW